MSADLIAIFAAEEQRLRRFLQGYGPALSVEDIAQDTYARMHSAKLSGLASPKAYLFTIARNLALNELRRVRMRRGNAFVNALELDASPAPSPEDQVIAADEAARLRAALAALPERQRQALILFKVEGLTHKEIGARLGVSHRTVERYVADALARCQALLGSRDG